MRVDVMVAMLLACLVGGCVVVTAGPAGTDARLVGPAEVADALGGNRDRADADAVGP